MFPAVAASPFARCAQSKMCVMSPGISEDMLARARRPAQRLSLTQVEFTLADMSWLPFANEEADLFLF
jgi:ubiquinone/menaquinone biosynthesis C-methylase UbiE